MRRTYVVKSLVVRDGRNPKPLVPADLVDAARDIATALPSLTRAAERAGLQLVAQHLNKALQLAERVAASEVSPSQSCAEKTQDHRRVGAAERTVACRVDARASSSAEHGEASADRSTMSVPEGLPSFDPSGLG